MAEEPGDFTNLALAALTEHHAVPVALVGVLYQRDRSGGGHLAVKLDATAPLAQHIGTQWRGEKYAILLLDFKARMGQIMRKFTIIGEQYQPLAIHIEATHGKNAGRRINKLNDRRTTVGVIHRRDIAYGLVEHYIGALGRLTNGLPIEEDHILLGVDPQARLLNDTAIHRDAAGGDQGL